MRRIQPALLFGLVLLAATPVNAGGLNLTWSRCNGEGVGSQNRTFACDTNEGSEVLVGSFVLNQPIAQVSGNEVYIDLISQDDPLPAWWDMKNAGSCRQTSLTLNTTEDASDVVCADWARGGSTGGIGFYASGNPMADCCIDPSLIPRHRRLGIAVAVPPSSLQDLIADVEYFSFNLVIDHAKTVGTGACGGCAGSVCLVFNHINITTPVFANNVNFYGGTTPGSDMARWQGTGADCLLVPVKSRTWGEVKAMYR